MPGITVVTPTYNRRLLLERLWASLREQTLSDFEWILVDDGSTDATQDWARRITDHRVLYIIQSNAGPGSARNTGVASAHSEFVTFIDSDHVLLSSTSLDAMLQESRLMSSDVGVVAFRCESLETGELIGWVNTQHERVTLSSNEIIGFRHTWGDMVHVCRREIVEEAGGFPPYHTGGEHLFWWEVARRWRFTYVNRPLVGCRTRGSDSLTVEDSVRKRAESVRMTQDLVTRFSDIRERDPKSWNAQILGTCLTMCTLGQRRSGWRFLRANYAGRMEAHKLAVVLLFVAGGKIFGWPAVRRAVDYLFILWKTARHGAGSADDRY